MFVHVLLELGLQRALERLFALVEEHAPASVLYVNSLLPAALQRALAQSCLIWTRDDERLKSFHYERAGSVSDILALVERYAPALVAIERLDLMVLLQSYAAHNRDLTHLLAGLENVVLLDSWDYVSRYYAEEVHFAPPKLQ